MWKHVLVLLATIAAFAVSLVMFQQAVGPGSPWMGLLLMLCLLGTARIAEPIHRLRVPGVLREIRPWERGGDLYEAMAVPQFGGALRTTPLRLLNPNVYFSRRSPAEVVRQLEAAEASHLWATLLLMPWLVWCAVSGRWAVFALLLVVQVLGNVYPILHLRWARGRLERVVRRLSRATANQA
ncbi:MAG TPA: hypothetical protein VFQ07_14995 [Candidatus Polarisedimenticolia bacterium]|nr:hypothetical protein [Candidatus Polarisedimenticolia bacterium]